MPAAVRVPLRMRAKARRLRIEKQQRAEKEAAAIGPFVVVPRKDPLPIPPADDALPETAAPVQLPKASGDRLRELWDEWTAGQAAPPRRVTSAGSLEAAPLF